MMERVPQPVREMLALLRESGHTPYLVGGCVRDLLRGAEPDDYDMTSDARPEEVMALFGADAHPTGLMHGTVTLVRGGFAVEHTTKRCDGAYRDSRHPESVRFTSSIEEDLARRDFTVNAIALSADGRLVDPFGGQADLRRGVLRAVPGDGFAEDPLRVLRGAQFASRFHLSPDEETLARMRTMKTDDLSPARVLGEMKKAMAGDAPDVFFDVLRRADALKPWKATSWRRSSMCRSHRVIIRRATPISTACWCCMRPRRKRRRRKSRKRERQSWLPPITATAESRGDDMRGKQSSKISLKKRLLKRRQALTRRWDKQSTRRHLPLYLLLLSKT